MVIKKSKFIVLATIFIVVCLSPMGIFIYSQDLNKRAGVDKVCDMFISNGQLNYVDFNYTLYRYDNSTALVKKLAGINISPGARVFKNDNYIYKNNLDGSSEIELIYFLMKKNYPQTKAILR